MKKLGKKKILNVKEKKTDFSELAGRLWLGLTKANFWKLIFKAYKTWTVTGKKLSNNLQTNIPPSCKVNKAVNAWHNTNCSLNNSCLFSLPSTENPYHIIWLYWLIDWLMDWLMDWLID